MLSKPPDGSSDKPVTRPPATFGDTKLQNSDKPFVIFPTRCCLTASVDLALNLRAKGGENARAVP